MTDLKLEERIPVLSWGLRTAISATVALSLVFLFYAGFTRSELLRSARELERPFAERSIYRDYIDAELQAKRGSIPPTPSQAVEADPEREERLRLFAREANLSPEVASALNEALDREFKIDARENANAPAQASSPPIPPPMRALSQTGEAKLKAFAEANQMTVSQARALYGWQFEKEYGPAPEGAATSLPSPELKQVLRNADWSNVINPVLGPAFLAFLGSLIVTSLISYFATERHLGWIRLSIALALSGMIAAFLIGMFQEASLLDTLPFSALAFLIGLLTPTTVRRVMRWIQSGFRVTTVAGAAQAIPEGNPAIVWGLTGGVKKGLALTGLTVMLISVGSIVFPQILDKAVSASLASVMIAVLAWGASIWRKQRQGRQ